MRPILKTILPSAETSLRTTGACIISWAVRVPQNLFPFPFGCNIDETDWSTESGCGITNGWFTIINCGGFMEHWLDVSIVTRSSKGGWTTTSLWIITDGCFSFWFWLGDSDSSRFFVGSGSVCWSAMVSTGCVCLLMSEVGLKGLGLSVRVLLITLPLFNH